MFNKKEGVEEQFPEVTENSFYEKIWNHLEKRELRNFGLTNDISNPNFNKTGYLKGKNITSKSTTVELGKAHYCIMQHQYVPLRAKLVGR